MKLATFDDFVKLANFFYVTIGIEPYRREKSNRTKAVLAALIFYLGFINLNYLVTGEIIFIILSLRRKENFREVIMTLSYVGFVLVANTKMIFIYRRKSDLNKLVQGLQLIFPKSLKIQKEYKLIYYLQFSSRITMGFSILYMILIWTFNLLSIAQYLFGHEEQTLPYLMLFPWEWRNHWSYYLLYFSQTAAGYTAAAGQISSDLLLVACTTQIVMHFDFISHKLASYQVKGTAAKADFLQDLEFLRFIAKYHTNILNLTTQLNGVFGMPLFLNFAASSFIICFVGFQITLGAPPETVIKLFLFLVCAIVQVYMICHYGQLLIDASKRVAEAAFEQNWFAADVRYKRMLVFIAARAQKPALMKATSFVLISRETMTKIMQLSYKFFALLKTLFGQS